jgi:CHAT domain-containing protein
VNHSKCLQRATFTLIFAVIAATCGCAYKYRMGDPIEAQKAAKSASSMPPTASAKNTPTPTPAAPLNRKEQATLDEWDAKWLKIQRPPDQIDWVDHFRVCAIKYRYRNYDALFRCLDLFEAKVARGGKEVSHLEAVRHATPVLTGWMRATAYAELGEPEVALKWAESAWNAMPEDYRKTKQSFFGGQVKSEFWDTTYKIAGSHVFNPEDIRHGRDNPAGLDMSAETIAMSLCAARSLLYQQRGESEKARIALAELRQWESLRNKDKVTMLIPTSRPFKVKAELLSLGPLFAMGEYAEVVQVYDASAAAMDSKRHKEQFNDAVARVFVLQSIYNMIAYPFTRRDARLFSVAVEDASNAFVYAQALIRLGRIDDARAMLDTLLAMPELRAMGNLYWVALYERSLIAQKDGQRDEAIRLLRQSVEAIESVRSTISFEAAKIGFAGDKQTVYAALVSALAQTGDWNDAFLVAERAKARALVDLLAQRRDLAPPPSVDAKVRELFASASTVDGGVGLASDESSSRGIKLVIDSRIALSSTAPEAASLVSVQSVSIAAIAARISTDETLIDYYSAGDDLYALVLNGTRVAGFTLPAKGLVEEVRSYRSAIERRDPDAAERGRPLYDRLIRPLVGEIKGTQLTISPHGVLHYLPFSALLDGDEFLLDRYSLRLIPSAGSLVYIRTDRPTKTGTLLALGNPDLGNARYDLPNAQIEAVKVAALFPSSRALVRKAASKSAIEELGNGFSMLHFATHGKFNTDDPLKSGLYLAKGNDADGILTVSDLYNLRWDVDLVTLSACETALGKVANGDDVIGLTRGFLYAGARSIVASLWEVDDAATAQLMLSFYRNQQDHDKREALRLAQIETRKEFPQPAFWAAFQIVGRAD